MPVALPCPPASRLRALALGLLHDDEINSLEEHVLSCATCAGAIGQLADSDGLVEALRHVASTSVPQGQNVNSAIERACRLGQGVEATGSGDTADSLDETAVQKPASPPELVKLIGQILSPAKSPDELGWLGPYRVLQLIGHGGMGLLFLAEDGQLRRRVALKVMQPRVAAAPDAKSRFLREARAAAALKHDNIVTIHHVGEDRGVFWLAMELLEGEPLDRRLKQQGRLSVLEALQIGRHVAEGLAAAHARGVIHRDIKPGNIWLESSRQRAKVLDFGLARATQDEAELTQSGDIVGTPAYMSPEQARGDEVDHRSDLFSLGCVLYCILVGKTPFGGKDTMATLSALATKTPAPLRDLVPEVPAALGDLVTKLLSKEPADRPQTATEVAAALLSIETELSAPHVPPPPLNVPLPPPPITLSSSAPRSALRVPHSVFLVAASLLLGGLILAGILLKIRTAAGTIVVEVDQPEAVGAEVSIDGQQRLTIRSPDSKEPIRVVADSNEHTLKVKKGGFETYTRQFTVKSGKTETVRVRLEQLANPAPNNPDGAASNLVDNKSESASLAANGKWTSLFNGRDLRGWIIESGDPKRWEVEEGMLRTEGTSPMTHLLTDRDYSDFILKLEFSFDDENVRGGIVLRAVPNEHIVGLMGKKAEVIRHPLLLLQQASSDVATTGTLQWMAAERRDPENRIERLQTDRWNRLEIEMRGTSLRATLNGSLLTKGDALRSDRLSDGGVPGLARTKGRIGLISNRGSIRFRNIEIMELPEGPSATVKVADAGARAVPSVPKRGNDWVPLFNGRDIRGWSIETGSEKNWRADGSSLIGVSDQPGSWGSWLISDRDYANFVLRFELNLDKSAQAFVGLRAIPGEAMGNKVAKLPKGIVHPHFDFIAGQDRPGDHLLAPGSSPNVVRVNPSKPIVPGVWHRVEIEMRDRFLRLTWNGETVLTTDVDPTAKAKDDTVPGPSRKTGRIALRVWDGTVRFRELEIMTLP